MALSVNDALKQIARDIAGDRNPEVIDWVCMERDVMIVITDDITYVSDLPEPFVTTRLSVFVDGKKTTGTIID